MTLKNKFGGEELKTTFADFFGYAAANPTDNGEKYKAIVDFFAQNCPNNAGLSPHAKTLHMVQDQLGAIIINLRCDGADATTVEAYNAAQKRALHKPHTLKIKDCCELMLTNWDDVGEYKATYSVLYALAVCINIKACKELDALLDGIYCD